MQAQQTPQGAMFSFDGYVVDQTRAQHVSYGRFGSDYNGCGWMAAYNILRALGTSAVADTVRTELSQGLRFGGRFGTAPLRFARYLRAHGAPVRITVWRKHAIHRAQACRAGAVFYWNGWRRGAHYVAFSPTVAVGKGFAIDTTTTAPPATDNRIPYEQPLAAKMLDSAVPCAAPAPQARTLRFFNAVPGAQSHTQTLLAFCAQHCLRAPALFFTVE